MRQNQVHSIPQLKQRRDQLRKNLTAAEAALWSILVGKQLKGRKFRRQHSIDHFIVDFYCASEKLIIELDGEVHRDPGQAVYDHWRDERLKALGYKVLRFENKLVFEQGDLLLEIIADCFVGE
jgi:very-short-patch-repair endonuclease